ncbi:hypothetical protein HJC23_003507 [Cyclotella cryptica]|uniref:DUF7495 domain-containing protein n=1 Tax=Cyclotella cryptica TaxID=29204 RepID=A0ABD3PEF7_9STRA|eukprot:CCRYP_016341-RA/>CCRYP_016341-RA protein AED:0.08 eAED:0.08 QI:302/-1/1/1/-1/1/1/2028/714
MNHIRSFLLGDFDEANAVSGGSRESPTSSSQYGDPPSSGHRQQSTRRERRILQDDLYLSDDDDWGMSALSATQSSLKRPNAYQDHRYGMSGFDHYDMVNADRSREIFWDQNSVTGNEAGKVPMGADRKVAGEMQSWEKASMYQDSLNDAFQIGDDDYYHSDQRSLEEDKKAYDAVQEDIRSVEEEQEEDEVDDDNKEEVANAYRDYLKSIREGGFESYLNNEDDVEAPDFDNIYGDDKNTPVLTNKKGSSSYQENVLEIEEDRSLYGNLYGVRDMRAHDSPYSSWRAKAQALVDYDNKRQRGRSPVRTGIDRFRRKGALNVDGGRGDFEDDMVSRGRSYNYSQPLFHNQRFKRFCFCSVLVLALIVGLYNSVGTKSQQESSQMAIPPKNEASSQHKDPQLYLPPNSNNAIANTLKTFDPVWYHRRSGWEGITFTDAVNFCKSKQKRVPCSYELYCNEGPGLPPYQGVKTNGEQWAAISNGPNQWVQVGTIDNDPSSTCQTYKQIYQELPDWGITGISKEHAHGAGGITQNLMCCLDANHLESGWWKPDDDEDADSSATSNANTAEDTTEKMHDPTDGNAAVASNNSKIQQREKAVISAFQPVWFATSHGWSGTTYDDAIDFCASFNHMVLCPFSAYCPNGPGSPPLSGSMVLDVDGEEWAPVNGPLNSWVQLGKINGDPASQCALHHDLLGNRPQWGIDGTRPEIKHHVMCCLM